MKPVYLVLTAFFLSMGISVQAQDTLKFYEPSKPEAVSHKAFNLGANGIGIRFGNSKNHTGLRFNLIDRSIARIKGLNFTV